MTEETPEADALIARLRQKTAGVDWYRGHLKSITETKYEPATAEEKTLALLCSLGKWKSDGEKQIITTGKIPIEDIRKIKTAIPTEIKKKLHLTFIYDNEQTSGIAVMNLQDFRRFADKHKYGEMLSVVDAKALPARLYRTPTDFVKDYTPSQKAEAIRGMEILAHGLGKWDNQGLVITRQTFSPQDIADIKERVPNDIRAHVKMTIMSTTPKARKISMRLENFNDLADELGMKIELSGLDDLSLWTGAKSRSR
jgi:hypothetical protein